MGKYKVWLDDQEASPEHRVRERVRPSTRARASSSAEYRTLMQQQETDMNRYGDGLARTADCVASGGRHHLVNVGWRTHNNRFDYCTACSRLFRAGTPPNHNSEESGHNGCYYTPEYARQLIVL